MIRHLLQVLYDFVGHRCLLGVSGRFSYLQPGHSEVDSDKPGGNLGEGPGNIRIYRLCPKPVKMWSNISPPKYLRDLFLVGFCNPTNRLQNYSTEDAFPTNTWSRRKN